MNKMQYVNKNIQTYDKFLTIKTSHIALQVFMIIPIKTLRL